MHIIIFLLKDLFRDTYSYFRKLQTRNICFVNTRIDFSQISGYYETVKLENMPISGIDCLGKVLDITNSVFKDIDVIVSSSFRTLIVSHKQYLEYQLILDKCGKDIIVMEENGQFISKEVKANG